MEEQLITVTRLVVVLCTWVLSASPLAADQLRAGVARVDITPGESMPMYGYANRKCGPSNGTHDPLMAKVLVLEGGGSRIALVTADLGSLVSDTLRRIEAMIAIIGFLLLIPPLRHWTIRRYLSSRHVRVMSVSGEVRRHDRRASHTIEGDYRRDD